MARTEEVLNPSGKRSMGSMVTPEADRWCPLRLADDSRALLAGGGCLGRKWVCALAVQVYSPLAASLLPVPLVLVLVGQAVPPVRRAQLASASGLERWGGRPFRPPVRGAVG